MSKKMVNTLKTKVRKSQYTDLRPTKETLNSGCETYDDLGVNFNWESEFSHDLVINGKVITNDFIKDLYSEHENLIPKDTETFVRAGTEVPDNSFAEKLIAYWSGCKDEDEKEDQQDKNKKGNYRLFLKAVFTEMFWRAGAKIPNNSIMEELITYYNRFGYMEFFSFQSEALRPFGLRVYSFKHLVPSCKERICMDCDDSNCLKFSFNASDGVYDNNRKLVCDLHTSVEFKLKCESENVTYEEGKVSLTTPKELRTCSQSFEE